MADGPDLGKRIVYRVDGMDRVDVRREVPYREDAGATLRMNVYAPPTLEAGARLPALFFVHGGPIPAEMPSPTGWGIFESYGTLAAASGLVGVTFNHRLHTPQGYPRAEDDIRAAIGHVRDHADELRVDRDRIGLWGFSGGGPLLSWVLRERPAYVRCLLAFYALLDLRHLTPPGASPAAAEQAKAFSPAAQLGTGPAELPVFVARAGRDGEWINRSIDLFVCEALAANMALEVLNHAQGQHVFDARDDDERSREIIARAIEFARRRLLGG